MSGIFWLALPLLFTFLQDVPAYVRAGDRVEGQLRAYKDRLNSFYETLLAVVERDAEELLPRFSFAPPPIALYGYQIVPRLIEQPLGAANERFESRSYSWPITETYIAGEEEKLRRVSSILGGIARTPGGASVRNLEVLIREYRELVNNQRTIDQYIQYNRLWQRAIATDRPRFDQMTDIYYILKEDSGERSEMVRRILGEPEVPQFVRVVRPSPSRTVLRIRVYTDIQDDAFLRAARTAIERIWRVKDGNVEYLVELDLRRVSASSLYRDGPPPRRGTHLDLRTHAARFPEDGAVLTTGAEATHAFVGRFIALGPAALTANTLAHEFGHVLGFRDGYVRGYRDIGESGYEIMELTSASDFHDIMSAPQAGRVLPAHFKLILDSFVWPGR